METIYFQPPEIKPQYCEAGIEGGNNCRRFQCKQKFGKVPENLLPNSNKSLQISEGPT